MQFMELSEQEFMNFVNKRPEKNFFQTVSMMNKIKKDGKEVYLVGVKEEGKIIGASLIAETGHKFLGKKTYEAYKGYVLDYRNNDLLRFMTNEVKKFLQKKKALRLIIDPYIQNLPRDADANIVDGIDNRPVREYLKRLGYVYNENGEQVKWTYCLDIKGKTAEEIFNEMKSSKRNIINKTISKFKLNIRTLKRNELSEFKKITSEASERREFDDKPLSYYEKMYDCFKDEVTFKICELNCDVYIDSLEEENKVLKEKLDKLSDALANRKKKENIELDINNNNKKIEEAKELKEKMGNIIPLAGAMFMLYGDEVVYLFSGSYSNLMNYCGQYRLQWEMIKYAADNKYRRYNFYGIEDVFNPQGKDRGVYEFKKGFGGYVEELLGFFILPISPFNGLYELLRKIKGMLKLHR